MDVRSRQAAAWMVFLVAAGAALAGLSVPALSAPAGGRAEFKYSGAEQTFVVPEGVFNLKVTAYGARGGYFPPYENVGGFGGMASATVPVLPGEKLYVEVGGQGHESDADPFPPCGLFPNEEKECTIAYGGFNGGGNGGAGTKNIAEVHSGAGGGGASDVRTISSAAPKAETLGSRLVVAGGGGGMGAPPAPRMVNGKLPTPASGGFLLEDASGANGEDTDLTLQMGGRGGGAGAGAGGAGGEGGDESEGPGCHGYRCAGYRGESGQLGSGGDGTGFSSFCKEAVEQRCKGGFSQYVGGGGGGGGGGYFGGGGGGSGGLELAEFGAPEEVSGGGGGGGAGSSYAPGGSTGVAPKSVGPNGLVVLEWTGGETGPTGATGATGSTGATGKPAEEERGEPKVEEVEVSGTEEPNVKIKIKCKALFAHSVCKVLARTEVKEDIVDNRVIAVTAARRGRHHKRARSRRTVHKTIVVGEADATIPAGQTGALTVKLNAAGKRLLRKRRRLPVQLRVLQLVQGRQEALKSVRVTLERHKRRKRRARR